MFRFIIAAVIIYTIYRLWKKAGRNSHATQSRREVGSGEMTACSKCGTFVLISEAIVSNGSYYCSTECLKS